MYDKRNIKDYVQGVEEFVKCAEENKKKTGKK